MSVNTRDVSCVADISISLQRIKLHVNSLKSSSKSIKNTIFSVFNSLKCNTSASDAKKSHIKKKTALKNISRKIKIASALLIIIKVSKNNSSTEFKTKTNIRSNIK